MRIVAFALTLLLTIAAIPALMGAQVRTDPSGQSPFEEPDRSLAEPGTSPSFFRISPDGPPLVQSSDNISSPDGIAYTFERNDLTWLTSIPASYLSISELHGRRNVISRDNITYISFIRASLAEEWISFWLISYHETERILEDPVLVHNFSGYSRGSTDIAATSDTLYYAMRVDGDTRDSDRLYVKITSLAYWYTITSSQLTQPSGTGSISDRFTLTAKEGGMLASWKNEGNNETYCSTHDGVSWSPETFIRAKVDTFCTTTLRVSGAEHLLFIYTNLNGENINLSRSLNGGGSWGTTYLVNRTGPGITSLSCTVLGETVHVAALAGGSRKVHYMNGLKGADWSSKGVVLTAGINGLDPVPEVQIAADRSEIVIASEMAGGKVALLSSEDGGETFSGKESFGLGLAHCVSLGTDKGYLMFINSTDLEVWRFVPSRSGRLLTVPFAPIGIVSWDNIGISHSGFEQGSSLKLRVLDPSLTRQLYPDVGSIDILSLSPGSIDKTPFDGILALTGGWAAGTGMETEAVMELEFERGGDAQPALFSLYLNYTTSFPLSIPVSKSSQIVTMVNCTISANGLKLDRFRGGGSAVIGPIVRDAPWPDVLSLGITSASSKVSLRAGILDGSMRPLPGFLVSGSRVVKDLSKPNYILWGERNLKDLPATLSTVYIELDLDAEEPTTDLTVKNISMGPSAPPKVDLSFASQISVLRGKASQISILVSDREDDPTKLRVSIEHKSPESGIWSSKWMEGALWKGNSWTVLFRPGLASVTGTYQFRAFVEDTTGKLTGPVMLSVAVEVLNNPPNPPMISVLPDAIITGGPMHIRIIRPGSDLETEQANLTYSLRLVRNGELFRETDGLTTSGYDLEEGILKKGELWQVTVLSFDGALESAPVTIEVVVLNSPPELKALPDLISLSEDAPSLPLDIDNWVYDRDGDAVAIEHSTSEGFSAVEKSGGLVLVPDPDWNGEGTLRLTASDDNATVARDIPVLVGAMNDLPVLLAPESITVDEGLEAEVWIYAFDEKDDEAVKVKNDAQQKVPGLSPGQNYLLYPNGSFLIRTSDVMIGEHTIKITAEDPESSVTKNFTLKVRNVNDPPLVSGIATEPEMSFIWDGEPVTLRANASDPDARFGDVLSYNWSSSIDGDIGSGREITVLLSPGRHTIVLRATDIEGLNDTGTLFIEVLPQTSPEKDAMRTMTLLLIIIAATALISILIAFGIIALTRKGKGAQISAEARKEPEKPPEKEPPGQGPKEPPSKGGGEGNV